MGKSDAKEPPRPLQPEDVLLPDQPGHGDIKFDVKEDSVPKWVQNVLRRIHTNLGHPSNESLVRHLAQAGASGQALLGAKHLKCSVCLRTRPPRQPRPSKAVQSRRFNDRVFLDIIYIKNVAGTSFTYLNILDDATTYQVLEHLPDRSEETVTRALVGGWLRYFGCPDQMVLDAEGSFRGFKFETLMAQSGIQIRFVPPDAHYQLGKAERHGQAIKWMSRRLISQFAAMTEDEMNLTINMCLFAKNSMTRRSGASPTQWVFGRLPKIPTALLSEPEAVEAKQLLDNSSALMQIEAVRQEAMKSFIDYEFDQSLRKAVLRKGRPWRGPLEIGQKVAYFRLRNQFDGEGTTEGYRQGMIIGLDPGPTGSVWLRNNRGRVVQASREQIRSVEGEELWTPNSDDIKALKDTEIDLSRKHALAFHQKGHGPSALDDRQALRLLDAAGQPLEQPQTPLVLPVPRLDLPQEEQRSSRIPSNQPSSFAEAAPQPETPVQYLPLTPAWIPIQEQEEEPNTRTASKLTQDTIPSQLKIEDASPALEDRRLSATSEVSQARQSLKRGPEVEIDRLENQEGKESKVAMAPRMTSSGSMCVSPNSILLAYCKDCGTREPEPSSDNNAKQCPRCMSSHFVSDPREVHNWFDEVQEQEAFQQAGELSWHPFFKRWLPQEVQHSELLSLPRDPDLPEALHCECYITGCGQVFNQLPECYLGDNQHLWSVAVQDPKQRTWEWTHVFEQIGVDPVLASSWIDRQKIFINHGKCSKKKFRHPSQQPETRYLRRHGRHCRHVSGWDGSPPELPPAYVSNNFAYAYFIDAQQESDDFISQNTEFPEYHHTSIIAQAFNTKTDQIMVGDESSEDEEEAGMSRAMKQAMKREVPWGSISESDRPQFLAALRDEWSEWRLWSSCMPKYLKDNEVDPSLILKSRVCYRWKPKDGGKWFKAKARIVILGFRDPHLPLLTRDAPVLAIVSPHLFHVGNPMGC